MRALGIIITIMSVGAGCVLMYFGLKHMKLNEIIITLFCLICLIAFIAGSLSRATKAYDAMLNCKHEKFIGDVCASCGYCFNDDKKL